MSEPEAIPVVAVGRGPVSLENGRVLAHGETADAPEGDHTRALIDAGHLVIDEVEAGSRKQAAHLKSAARKES